MSKAPAFQFYPSDWQRDLDDHPLEIEGAWIRICGRLYWTEGTATKNLEEWSRILRKNQKKTQEILQYLADKGIGDLVNQNGSITITCRRMVRDARIRKIRKEAGIKGGNPALMGNKTDEISLTKTEAKREQNGEQKPTPSSSSSSSTTKNKKIKKKKITATITPLPSFLFFWNKYPRKEAKQEATKCWNALDPDEILAERILSALDKQIAAGKFATETKYILLPTTWLNQHRWEDEIETTPPHVKEEWEKALDGEI